MSDAAAARRAARRHLQERVRALLGLDDDAVVMVNELQCAEPGCPPVETVIAVLSSEGRRQIAIHKPLAEVTEVELASVKWMLGA